MFVVRSITVTGTHLVSPAQVITAADVPLGTPLMRVNPGAVTRRVEAIRQVASATVSEDWPDHLTIAVTERVPVLAVRMAGGGYDLLDPSGVIVRWATTKPRGLPLFVTTLPGSALRGDPGVAAAAAVLTELTPALARTVTTVSVAQVLSRGRTGGRGGAGDALHGRRQDGRVGESGQRRGQGPRDPDPAPGRRQLPGRERAGDRGHTVIHDTRADQGAWLVDHDVSPPYCPYQS